MADVKTPFVGGEDSPDPILCYLDVEANTQIEGGRLAWSNASGNAIPSSSATTSSKCWGVYTTNVNNLSTNTPYGAAGAQKAEVRQGVALLRSSDGTAVKAAIGTYVYLVGDSGTTRPDVSTDDAGGTRPLVGYIVPTPRGATAPDDASMAPVRIAGVRADANNPELAASRASAFTARNVATSLPGTYTVTAGVLLADANGALGAQDGVTNVVNDVIILPVGTVGSGTVSTATSGPWKLTAIGGASAKFAAIRPDWWAHGSNIIPGSEITVGGEGTLFGGTTWKTWAAASVVINTGDPLLYPTRVTQQITLAAGTKTLSNIPIRNAAYTGVSCAMITGGTPAGTTTNYTTKSSAAGITAGALGTAAVIVEAQSVAGTIVNTDVAKLNVTIMQ